MAPDSPLTHRSYTLVSTSGPPTWEFALPSPLVSHTRNVPAATATPSISGFAVTHASATIPNLPPAAAASGRRLCQGLKIWHQGHRERGADTHINAPPSKSLSPAAMSGSHRLSIVARLLLNFGLCGSASMRRRELGAGEAMLK